MTTEPLTHYAPNTKGLVGDVQPWIACGTLHWAVVSEDPDQVTCPECREAIAPANPADFAAMVALPNLREHFPKHADDPAQHLLKLGEEYGELTGACVRYLGRSRRLGTLAEVESEAGDMLITLHVLAASLGIDLDAAWRAKAAKIAARPWRENGDG